MVWLCRLSNQKSTMISILEQQCVPYLVGLWLPGYYRVLNYKGFFIGSHALFPPSCHPDGTTLLNQLLHGKVPQTHTNTLVCTLDVSSSGERKKNPQESIGESNPAVTFQLPLAEQ